ncbi:MAG: uroporphyrinogen-III synthase [Polymorphobacter sp.]
MWILVTRPLPGGESTAARLRAAGHDAIVMPLMATEAVPWQPPLVPPAAIMLTSAFAARLAGPGAAAWHGLPTYTVGTATARAAAAAGFTHVIDGGGTVQAVVDRVSAAGLPDILHLAGADRTAIVIPAGLNIATQTVYRARLLPMNTMPAADLVLLFSPRSAAHFAAECDRLGVRRDGYAIAAISAVTAAAAGPGWRCIAVAPQPDEEALLAVIAATWQDTAERL